MTLNQTEMIVEQLGGRTYAISGLGRKNSADVGLFARELHPATIAVALDPSDMC